MKNNLITKLILVLTLFTLIGGIFFLLKDIQYHKDAKIHSKEFYKASGIATQLTFNHPFSNQSKKQSVEITLQNKQGNWTYSSSQPNYIKLIEALRKCQQIEIVFKKADFLKDHSADIWDARVCGKPVINFYDTFNDKLKHNQNNHFIIKLFLTFLMIIFILTLAYFIIKN